MITDHFNGSVLLYHPSGIPVSLPVSLNTTIETAQAMLAAVDIYLQAGWLSELAPLDQDETVEKITHIARREKRNDDNSITPLVDVYCGGYFRTLSIYLNNPEDLEAFQNAFTYPVTDLALFEGDTAIERGKNSEKDKKFVHPVNGVSLVWKLNPRYEGEADKKHPKRLFVRWEGRQLAPAANGKRQTTPMAHTPIQSNSSPQLPAGATRKPEEVKTHIEQLAKQYAGKPISEGKRGVIAPVLELCFASGDTQTKRHQVQLYLTGKDSISEIPDNYLIALFLWLNPTKDSGGAWAASVQAAQEANAILSELERAGGRQPQVTPASLATPAGYQPPF